MIIGAHDVDINLSRPSGAKFARQCSRVLTRTQGTRILMTQPLALDNQESNALNAYDFLLCLFIIQQASAV